jgi:hypothetical protein
MGRYGTLQGPSLPVPESDLVVTIPGDGSGRTWSIRAILDTGAALTCIPGSLAEDLIRWHGVDYRRRRVSGPVGTGREVRVFRLNIGTMDSEFPELEVCEIERDYAIIGGSSGILVGSRSAPPPGPAAVVSPALRRFGL